MTAREEIPRLSAENAELFARLLEDPNVNELAQIFYARGHADGRARGVAEERLDRARQRKGRKGNVKRPGRPQKIPDLLLELFQKVVERRVPGVSQVEAIEEFQEDYKRFVRGEGFADIASEPFLNMDPDSILATMRQRLRPRKE
jgi:hypothetical protein